MAPEQWQCPEAVDNRADQFALGIMFYELLTGRLPEWPVATPSTLNPSVPQSIRYPRRTFSLTPASGPVRKSRCPVEAHATELRLLSAATPCTAGSSRLFRTSRRHPLLPGGPSPCLTVAMMPQLVPAPQESLPSATAGQGGRAVVRQENHPVGVPATYVPDIDLKSVLKTLQGSWSVWASKAYQLAGALGVYSWLYPSANRSMGCRA